LPSTTPAIAELPSLVQRHTFNLRVIRQMRDRADALIRQIEVLLSGAAVATEEG
jgi:hypothetical protein